MDARRGGGLGCERAGVQMRTSAFFSVFLSGGRRHHYTVDETLEAVTAPPARASPRLTVGAITRGPEDIICTILNTHSPNMSYLAPSTSSFQFTERIGQGAVSNETQQQRYVSLSIYTCQRVNKHGPQATVHIRHRSTSLTITHFSTSFISIGHFF